MPAAVRLQVNAMGCRIAVSSGCQEALAILDRYIFPALPRRKDADSADQPHVCVRIDQCGNEFQLFVGDVLKLSASQPIGLVPELTRSLDDAVLRHLNGLWAVHAGAVQWDDRVLLLPGGTHSGKSSLVAELLQRGARYFSDEYAIIDCEGRVHPYPRPLLLRNAGPEQLPALPEDYNALTGTSPARIGWIFCLTYQACGAWSVDAISQSQGLIALLRNTPHVLAEAPNMMSAFHCAVQSARCYSGQRPEAELAADAILSLLEHPRPRH